MREPTPGFRGLGVGLTVRFVIFEPARAFERTRRHGSRGTSSGIRGLLRFWQGHTRAGTLGKLASDDPARGAREPPDQGFRPDPAHVPGRPTNARAHCQAAGSPPTNRPPLIHFSAREPTLAGGVVFGEEASGIGHRHRAPGGKGKERRATWHSATWHIFTPRRAHGHFAQEDRREMAAHARCVGTWKHPRQRGRRTVNTGATRAPGHHQ